VDLPKNLTEYAIWMGMQFPMLGATVFTAYRAMRYAERRYAENPSLYDERLGGRRGGVDVSIRHLPEFSLTDFLADQIMPHLR
jgi:hypothetical protein